VKNFSNTYIFIFSSVMVILVAALLSTAAMLLQPIQQKNIEIERKMNILSSIGIQSEKNNIESLYEKYIIESYIVNSRGDRKEGVDAFSVNMKDELHKPLEERNLAVYVGQLDNGKKKYVVPVRGNGLWGPIFGYISFNDDFNTIYGANFGNEAETPGLGAQITTKWFQDEFKGKKIFTADGTFTSIKVVKGHANPSSAYQVDALSGATLTSKGLEAMLYHCLSAYEAYFKKQMK